ncbi:MAG: transporter substrate-binding domain-containing protein [Lachnospiraceae bacterium]|nr:transporter substrate-binding domain-containing protein [Lachnospiraceae bacterium]
MKKRRRIAAILLLTLCTVLMSGCGSEKNGGLYGQIKQEGVLTAAVVQDNAPYSWYDAGTQTYSGIEIEILKAVAEELGVTLNYYPTLRAGLTEVVKAQEADIAIGRINEKDVSSGQVELSTQYGTGFLYVVTVRGDFSCMFSSFDGEQIGLSRKISDGAEVELYTIEDVTQTYYDTTDTVETDLLSGTIAGYFCYEEEAKALLASGKLQAQTITDYDPERYCIAVQKNNPDMIQLLNEVIQEMTEDGRLAQAILQYQ